MPTVQIVIDVAGEVAGSPAVARSFAYSKIHPAAPLVTLSLADTSGVTSYAWSIISQPTGASATLSSATAAAPTFTPTVSVTGTYLVQCIVNGGAAYGRNGLAFLTSNLGLRKPAPGETTQFSATRGWEVPIADLIDNVDSVVGAPPLLTGAGNPDGVQAGGVGQHYWDTTNLLFYVNHDGATGWYVV